MEAAERSSFPMSVFRRLSISRKLSVVTMLTSAVALIVACVALVAYDVDGFRKKLAGDLAIVADGIMNNSSAAIQFDDAVKGVEILQALKAYPHVEAAYIYKN